MILEASNLEEENKENKMENDDSVQGKYSSKSNCLFCVIQLA